MKPWGRSRRRCARAGDQVKGRSRERPDGRAEQPEECAGAHREAGCTGGGAWDTLDDAGVNTKGLGGVPGYTQGQGARVGPWGDLGVQVAQRRVVGRAWDTG